MKVLFLSAWFPYPPDNGSKLRVYHLLRALARRHEVVLQSFIDRAEFPRVDDLEGARAAYERERALEAFCQVRGVVPRVSFKPRRLRALLGFLSATPRSVVDTFSPRMAERVAQELAFGEFDVVVASQIGTAPYVLAAAATLQRQAQPRGLWRRGQHRAHPRRQHWASVFEEVELGVIRDEWAQAPGGLARWRAALTWAKTRRYTGRLVARFTAATVVSEQERRYLREAAPAYEPVTILPNGIDTEALQFNGVVPEPATLIYNGALSYEANYDAMDYFLAEIWPRIRAEVPQARLRITGRKDGAAQRLALPEGVTLTGYLPDIRPAVSRAWLAIAPLRVGGGTRVKVLEALALGTPVVATSKGTEGLEATHGTNVLIADEPQHFADEVVRLLGDPALRRHLAEQGRQLVEQRYNWQALGEQFNHLVESAAAAWETPHGDRD